MNNGAVFGKGLAAWQAENTSAVESLRKGYVYQTRAASEYAKLKYTPFTYFAPQQSRPYDAWVNYTMVFKMHKRIAGAIALSLLFFSAGVSADDSKASVAVKDETVLPEILAVSGNPSVIYGKGFPGTVTRTIRSSDKSAFFYASVRIVNPKKSKYAVKLECVDDAGNVVIEGTLQKAIFPMYRRRYMEGETGQIEVSLGLNPTAGAKVAQQRMILKDDTQYFIRLYVEERLISLTNFRYLIM